MLETFRISGNQRFDLNLFHKQTYEGHSTDRSAAVSVLVLLFVALWFILRGNLL